MLALVAVAGTSTTEEQLFTALDALENRYGSQRRQADDSIDQALDDVGATFTLLLGQLAALPDLLQLPRLSEFEQRMSSQRLLVAARIAGSSGDIRTDRRRAREALRNSSGSTRAVARDAKRAATIASNPVLREAAADGSISRDAIDHLAKAADTGTGVIPDELIQAVSGLTADQTADVVDRHLEERVDNEEVERRYEEQMRARTVRRYQRLGLSGIAIEGPDQLIDAMWANLDVASNRQYQAEGGRERSPQEQTSLGHRRFDAAHAALTGQGAGACQPGAGGRAAVVITVDGVQLFNEPDSPIKGGQLGSGPLPADVVADYLKSSPISVLVRGCDGSPLWLGRARRRATDQQFLALAVRDRGCVLCRANITRCEAHHIMPWTAPGRGRTDVDQMALLCGRCHGDLHHRHHTLIRKRGPDGQSIWVSRPATVDETPTSKPNLTRRE